MTSLDHLVEMFEFLKYNSIYKRLLDRFWIGAKSNRYVHGRALDCLIINNWTAPPASIVLRASLGPFLYARFSSAARQPARAESINNKSRGRAIVDGRECESYTLIVGRGRGAFGQK